MSAPPLPPLSAGERALVVGLGRSGLALARFLSGRGIRVRVCDRLPPERLAEPLAALPEGTEVVQDTGPEVLAGCAGVFASPGVAWDAELLERARARGLPVSSEIDVFFRLCPAPIVGVTGTNGKTTTTALVGRVLRRGQRPVLVGGNIGDTVLDRLGEVTPDHLVVLELSSFQLESCARPRPWLGVVLNLTPDHLDRHRTLEAYAQAKARLIRFQGADDVALLNGEDPGAAGLAPLAGGRVLWFDRHRPLPPVSQPGRHNLLNALAAAAVGRLAGIPEEEVADAIRTFPGVEHRLEVAGEWGGVRWVNDSKATNPEAALAGLLAFEGTPVVLIAGGHGDGFELGRWLEAVRERTRAAVLMGESADELERRLHGHPLRRAGSIEEAVELAAALARPGDVVLLSPAYKSYDMFANFEERGRRFKAAVRSLHGVRA